MYCENCWEMLPEGAKFCQICGTPVKKTEVNKVMGQSQYSNQTIYQQPMNPIQQEVSYVQSFENSYIDSDDEDTDPRWPIPVLVFSIISAVIGILLIVSYPYYIPVYFYSLTCFSLPAVFIPHTKRKPMLTMIPVSLFYISLLIPWILDLYDWFGSSHTAIILVLTVAIIIPQIFQFFFIKKRNRVLFAFMILSAIISGCSHIIEDMFLLGVIYHVVVCLGLLLADGFLIERHYDDEEFDYVRYNEAVYSLFCPNCGARFSDDGVTRFCNRCAAPLKWLERPEPMPYVTGNAYYNDYPSFGIAFLGFLFPMIGLIIFIVWHPDRPRRAASAGKGSLIGFIVYVIAVVVTYGIIFGWFK